MIRDEDCGNRFVIDVAEGVDDDNASVSLVLVGYFMGSHVAGDRNGAVKVIGVRSAKAGNRTPSLAPGGGEFGVGVSDATDFWKGLVEFEVRGEIGGRFQRAF